MMEVLSHRKFIMELGEKNCIRFINNVSEFYQNGLKTEHSFFMAFSPRWRNNKNMITFRFLLILTTLNNASYLVGGPSISRAVEPNHVIQSLLLI